MNDDHGSDRLEISTTTTQVTSRLKTSEEMEGQYAHNSTTPSGLPGGTEEEANRAKEEQEMRRNLMATVLDTAARERCTSFKFTHLNDALQNNHSISDCTCQS
jgi:DNA-binding TFAR19-related protein (PDSD5 family)